MLDIGVGLSLLSPRDLSIFDCGWNSEMSTFHFAISLATTIAGLIFRFILIRGYSLGVDCASRDSLLRRSVKFDSQRL